MSSSLRRGLPGYLILFAPHAFGSERQYMCQDGRLPHRMFLQISTYFTTTLGILPSLSQYSSLTVSKALPGLSPGLSLLTYQTACTRFTPSNSEQRLDPSYYRGCWHEVSRSFLIWYRQNLSSHITELYNPKAFIAHAASLHQSFLHCAIFPTAASRRSLDRVSVPVWLIIL